MPPFRRGSRWLEALELRSRGPGTSAKTARMPKSACGECKKSLVRVVIPSDTKLLLTKNYSEIIIFEKLRISYVIPCKSPSFPRILKVRSPSKITKINSQGIIFVIISCQRVFFSLTEAPLPDPAPTPPNTPKRSRNGAATEPKQSQTEPNGAETEPNGAETDRNRALSGGTAGGVCRGGGGWGL